MSAYGACRNIVFIVATALLMSAAAMWRLSPKVIGTLSLHNYLPLFSNRQIIPLSSPSSTWILSLPIFVIGVLLLRSLSSSYIPRQEADGIRQTSITMWRMSMIALLSLGTYLAAYILEQKGLLNNNSVALSFITLCLLGLLLFLRTGQSIVSTRLSITLGESLCLLMGVLVLTVIMAFDANSWRYSFIGDEYAFFWSAQGLLNPGNWSRWLEASGVYNGFPELTTVLQTVSLVIFGNDNFGWRMSCVLATTVCLPPLYIFLRWIASQLCECPRLCAALGCILFFSLEPVHIWARIGKPHAFFFPPIMFSLGALAWAQSTGRVGWYGISGFAAGLGCFLSPVGPSLALGAVAVLQVFFFLSVPKIHKHHILQLLVLPGALFALGAILGASPILVQKDYFEALSRLNLESAEATGNRHLLVQKTIQSFFSFLSHEAQGHFMIGNPFNLIVAMCILACFAAHGKRSNLLAFAGWTLLAGFSLSVGGLSQYVYPPPSRIHLLAVPLCFLATVGLAQLLRTRASIARSIVVLLCVLAIPITLIKITLFNPALMRFDERALIVRAVQQLTPQPTTVFLKDSDDFVKRILSGMMPNQSIVFVDNIAKMSLEDISTRLEDIPAESGVVIPDSLPTKDIAAIERFAGRVHTYQRWNSVELPDNLPTSVQIILSLLEITES